MHDFIESLAFTSGRSLLVARSAASGWIQRGIMRSFGEDDVVATYRQDQRVPVRADQKSSIKNRK